MSAYTHVCDPLCEPVVRGYAEGLSLVEVRARLGVGLGLVRTRLRRHGVILRPRRNDRQRHQVWADQAIRLYQEGRTLQAIGTAIGVRRERVRQVLRERGIPMRPKGRRGHRCNDACAVVLAATPPISIITLARQAKISWGRILRAVSTHHIPTSGRLHHRCSPRCEKIRALLAAGTSSYRTAQLVGVTASYLYQRVPTYHPEWNWARKRIRPANGGLNP